LLLAACGRTEIDASGPAIADGASHGDGSLSGVQPRCEVSDFAAAVRYTTSSAPGAIVPGDFTGDGVADLIVDEGSGQELFANTGAGSFDRSLLVAASANNYGNAVAGDFNRDGRLDLASQANSLLGIDFGLGGGALRSDLVTYATPQTSGLLAVGDFNGDGFPDIAFAGVTTGLSPVTNSGPGLGMPGPVPVDFALSVYLNAGDGTFNSMTTYKSPSVIGGIATGDFDGDGHLDIGASRNDGAFAIYWNEGDGAFGDPQVAISTSLGPATFAVADFDADGRDDVALLTDADPDASGAAQFLVYISAGGRAFNPPTSDVLPKAPMPGEIVARDFDGDGLPDLATSFWGSSVGGTTQAAPMAVFYNRGGGRFDGAVTYQVRSDFLSYVASFIAADLNADGIADLAISTATEDYAAPEQVAVLLSTCEQR
jgi:hypothetical protein